MQPDFPLPPDLLHPPGLVITPPDQLDEHDRIPYASTDRTPDGPLQQLEIRVAEQLEIKRHRLVSREGMVIPEHGAACLFEITEHEGDPVPGDRWVIAAVRGGAQRLRLRQRRTGPAAHAAYAEALDWLAL